MSDRSETVHLLKDTTLLCCARMVPKEHRRHISLTTLVLYKCVCVSSEDFLAHGNNEAMAVVLLHAYVGQIMYKSSCNGISISPPIMASRYSPRFFFSSLLHRLSIMERLGVLMRS